MTPRISVRLAALAPISVICLVAAILYARSFATTFTDMLSVLLILAIALSAINLAATSTSSARATTTSCRSSSPDGVYGSYNLAGLVSFFLGFGLEVILANLGSYQGPVARALDGGDIYWIVGIVVSGGCYLLMT